jgi:hypothetical protein
VITRGEITKIRSKSEQEYCIAQQAISTGVKHSWGKYSSSMKVRLEEPTLGLKIAMQLFQSVKHLLKRLINNSGGKHKEKS